LIEPLFHVPLSESWYRYSLRSGLLPLPARTRLPFSSLSSCLPVLAPRRK
jgi:hypothetical protein